MNDRPSAGQHLSSAAPAARGDACFAMRLALLSPLLLLLALPCLGCARVAAYERGSLAHPTMTTLDLARASEAHVRAVQEGAMGGGAAAGGGCGCN